MLFSTPIAADKRYNTLDTNIVTLSGCFFGADACATLSVERHQNSLKAIKGFCRQRTCKQLMAEIEGILFSRANGLPF